jgi:hypothetical protein
MRLPLLAALLAVAPAHADVTTVFPSGSVAATLTLPGEDCGEPWAVICVTTLARQRAWLLTMPTDQGFLEQAYRILLKRPLDLPGQQYWLAKLAQGTTRDAVLDALIASPEYRRLHL